MEITNTEIEQQLEKILKSDIVYYTKIEKFTVNSIYIDDFDINYFKNEIEIFKNYLFYFKAENLLTINLIENIKSYFEKRLYFLKEKYHIDKTDFAIPHDFCTSTNDFPPRRTNKINKNYFLKTPPNKDIIGTHFYYFLFSKINKDQYNLLLEDDKNGACKIENIKLQYILQLNYQCVNEFVQFLNNIIDLDTNFTITDFKSFFAPKGIMKLDNNEKCVLNFSNRESVMFFYFMYIYDMMYIEKNLSKVKKRSGLQRFFENNFKYVDENNYPAPIVNFQSQLGKYNGLEFDDYKKEFVEKIRGFLDDFEKSKVGALLENKKNKPLL